MAGEYVIAAKARKRTLAVVSRIFVAIFGGYVFAATASVFLSYILPMQRADALMTGILLSFAFYTGAIIWAFAARTGILAWAGILLPSIAMAAVCFAFSAAGPS